MSSVPAKENTTVIQNNTSSSLLTLNMNENEQNPSETLNTIKSSYYDKQYWEYQAPIGRVGGILNKFKFQDHILPENTVLDFGSGGGFLLEQLSAKHKMGYEINPSAKQHAVSLGIDMVDDLETMPRDFVDIVISNHALEHVPDPLNVLRQLYKIIRKGGLIVFVIPCEQPGEIEFQYREDDVNQHLYSWCPQSFGNLFKMAGFKIEQCITLQHKWTPDYQNSYTHPNYHERCRQYALEQGNHQIKCIGRKI